MNRRVFPRTWPAGPRRPWAIGLLSLAVAVGACSDSSVDTDPADELTLRIFEGQNLQAPAGTVLPEGPTVEVLDGEGQPVVSTTVWFEVAEGGGTSVLGSGITDSLGRIRGLWILGPEAGTPQRLVARTSGLSVEFTAEAISPVPGESYTGRQGYIEYFPGTLPLVLSAPHGGLSEPFELEDRTWGTMGSDRNTKDLALRIRSAAMNATGGYPHLIITHLYRDKLDPNREIVEAAQGDPGAERAWWEYHTFIDRASVMVEESHGEGLYIDIHGHGHDIPRLELGYLLSSSRLEGSDEELRELVGISSLRALASKPGVDFAALVRGPSSFGSLMEARSFPAVPSQEQPDPGGHPYFSAGYSTARHGSRDGGYVSGFQLECNYPGIRDLNTNRQAFAEALVDALMAYFPAHFGMELAPDS